MCDICGNYPCDSRCPNADDEHLILYCDNNNCKAEIYEGDDYYYIDDKNLCERCFEDYVRLNIKRTAELD